MLAILVITLIALSLLGEWMLHRLSLHYELVWWRPSRAEVKTFARRLLAIAIRSRKPYRLVKAERQMNGAFKDASDEIWLKQYHQTSGTNFITAH